MSSDRPLLGIALMAAFCVLAPMADAIAKILTQDLPVAEIVFIRFAAQFLIFLPIVMFRGRSIYMPPKMLALVALRTIFHIAGISAMFMALKYMPMAEVVAIAYVEPFLLLLLGWFFLKEHVGPHRITACAFGFFGAMLVIQPSFAAVGPLALLPLVVAVSFAFYMLITRKIVSTADIITLQTISGGMAMVILAPLYMLAPIIAPTGFEIIVPPPTLWPLLTGLVLLGTFAQLVMVWSLRYAPSATLAPVQYLEIPFATLIGLILFNHIPNGLAAIGIVITIGAGLYMVMRERLIATRT